MIPPYGRKSCILTFLNAFDCETKIATALAYGNPPPSAKEARVFWGMGSCRQLRTELAQPPLPTRTRRERLRHNVSWRLGREGYEFSAG